MAVRIRYIFMFVIILISFGTIVGCGEDDCEGIKIIGACLVPQCDQSERLCEGECVPFGVDCCFDSFSEFVGACTEEEPVCCPAGFCTSDFDLCPDVVNCREGSQPCGPNCILTSEICCHEGVDVNFHSCPESLPICCPLDTVPLCGTSFDECCNGTGCV